ncbi:right-handed parallel beta-helix repeat-containing protein [Pseudonocardia hispaniensis]|uniref:Right-handed parallel beta-helix repeat-containing protein n=1 Tax=Pseudonocardia hispaniensis TaxID=904933 RepID=A0ABW1J725_9PSEU
MLALGLAACSTPPPAPQPPPRAAVCDRMPPGPASPPQGAIVVDPGIEGDLVAKTRANPPGTTFWLAPGTHLLGGDQFSQVAPKDRDVYLGAPGAIIDGRGLNRYAFVGEARDVTIRFLTVRGFVPPQDQGVVNHDSGDGWVIEHNTVSDNRGAGLMAGAHQQVRGNCLRDNGQYGLNAFQPGNGIVGLVVEGNEITGNNTEDWETRNPGCGCTGGAKFWSVNGADIRSNWIHDNRGPGLWADTNNNDFLIEDNLIENNDGPAVFYETSYNLILRNNLLRRNTLVEGREVARSGDHFPIGTVYLSESGGEPRVPARTDKIEITGNRFEENWSGITAWENADRFCNSPANTSTDSCTLLVPDTARCTQPGIATQPLYSDCRWRTQRVEIHDNTFGFDPAVAGCLPGFGGRMAVLSNYGTYPDWSPYRAEVVQDAIVHDQQITWRDNRYVGPWTFVLGSVDHSVGVVEWQADPYRQDQGSTFTTDETVQPC